jgi:hypothetical protein
MEVDCRRQKLDLVWASIFLTVFAMWGLFVLAVSESSEMQLTAVAMACGLLFSLVTVPVLLVFSGNGRGLLVVGRVLVCLQLLCQVAAILICVLAIVRNA